VDLPKIETCISLHHGVVCRQIRFEKPGSMTAWEFSDDNSNFAVGIDAMHNLQMPLNICRIILVYTLLVDPYVCVASRARILHRSVENYRRTSRWSWNIFIVGEILDSIIRDCEAIRKLFVQPRI